MGIKPPTGILFICETGNRLPMKKSTIFNILIFSFKTGEKLWKKNLNLGSKSFSYTGSVRWDSKSLTFRRELTEDNNFWNPYTKELENTYTEALTILWRQFDVNELQAVAKEAKNERDKNKN